jgi:GNAT superfamily N-acetyltransferase
MTHLLRPAQVADIPVILGFIRDLAVYEKLLPQVEADAEKLRQTLFPPTGHPCAETLLAFEDGEPAGFALFFPTYSTFLARPGIHLEDLFVRPASRGRGIGKALICAVARLANERGSGRLEWTVLDWNQPAIEFYRALGAEILADWQICRLTGAALARFA